MDGDLSPSFIFYPCSEVSAVLSCSRRLKLQERRLQEIVSVAYSIGLGSLEEAAKPLAALGSLNAGTMTAVLQSSLAAADITVQVAVISATLRFCRYPQCTAALAVAPVHRFLPAVCMLSAIDPTMIHVEQSAILLPHVCSDCLT